MSLGSSGNGDGQLNRPTCVAVDNQGYIYVADWANGRLQVFTPEGSLIAKFNGDGTICKWGRDKLDANAEMWREREIAQGIEREKLFWGPIAVAVDAEDRVFVVKSARHRIQVYQKKSPVFFGGRL